MSTTSFDSFNQRAFNQSRKSSLRSLSNSVTSLTSWRSASSSRTLDSVKEAIRNSKNLNSETKAKLKGIYKDYELGKISREQLKQIVQKDLSLETNQSFERSVKSVNMSFTSFVRGIEKKEINLMTNYKPNTKEDQLAKQMIKTVSLNLYQSQRNPHQIIEDKTVKPTLVKDEAWIQKQLDQRIPDQKLFLPENLQSDQEKERLQVEKELRLPTNSHQSRNTVFYNSKGSAPETTTALKDNGDIVNLKKDNQVGSSKSITHIKSNLSMVSPKAAGLKKVSGFDKNRICTEENEWKSPTQKKLTQLKNSDNIFEQENMFRTCCLPSRTSQKYSTLKQMHASGNIISWD